MKRLPSERLFFNREELRVFTSGLTILVERAHGATIGCFPYQRHAWPPELNDGIYADRTEDPQLLDLLRLLRAKLAKYRYGRFRLNSFDLTALAFALRVARSVLDYPVNKWRRLANRIELARRRRVGATIRKLGKPIQAAFRQRWLRFAHWCRFNLLYSWMFNPIRPKNPRLAAMHRAELESFREWIRSLIFERCERGISEDELLTIARRTKRHVRQRRIRGRGVEEILADRACFADDIFKYTQRHLELPLKFEFLDLSRRQSAVAASLRRSLNTPSWAPVADPTRSESAAQGLPMPGGGSAHSLQPEPQAVVVSNPPIYGPRECTEAVVRFFLDLDLIHWEAVYADCLLGPCGIDPTSQRFPGELPHPSQLLKRFVVTQTGWNSLLHPEVDCLLWTLLHYVEAPQLKQILCDGYTVAQQLASARAA